MYPFGGFSFNNVNFVNPVHESDKFRFHVDIPAVVNTFFLQFVQICVSCSGHVIVISVELGMFLLSARRGELEVQCDDDRPSLLVLTKKIIAGFCVILCF